MNADGRLLECSGRNLLKRGEAALAFGGVERLFLGCGVFAALECGGESLRDDDTAMDSPRTPPRLQSGRLDWAWVPGRIQKGVRESFPARSALVPAAAGVAGRPREPLRPSSAFKAVASPGPRLPARAKAVPQTSPHSKAVSRTPPHAKGSRSHHRRHGGR